MQTSSRPPAKAKPPHWVGPSHISIFIRNLKLIRLDERKDWPGINSRTFSSSTQQNQRQRIKCVEWALYYLFTIWDPETANNKLRPFFPPLEPLQSLNLRAALFRALSELKKNGDLGRETILRKTMLDECKGDKFEEVLAVFSTTVVRKFLSKNGALQANPATALSTESQLTPGKQNSLLPLVLAHRVSLGSMLENRAQLQESYGKLCQHLDSKAADLANRREPDAQLSTETDEDSAAICRAVKGAWFGPEEWVDAIIQGGIQHTTDNMFELPFEETWSRVNKGDVQSLGYQTSPDLLVDLDRRVGQQKNRLHKWQEFRTLLRKRSEPRNSGAEPKVSSSPLLFRDHQSLTTPSISRSSNPSPGTGSQVAEYGCLVSAMNASLLDLKGDSARNDTNPGTSQRQTVKKENTPPVSADYQDALDRSSRHGLGDTSSRESSLGRDTESASSQVEPSPKRSNSVYAHDKSVQFEKPRPDMWGRSERSERLDPVKEDAQPAYKDPRLERPGLGSLLERTRQSMSLLTPPSGGPRHSINPRPSRQSQIFPINQFETPKKPVPQHGPGTTTPKEELFDADYASVFKSRPKIATSPVVTPMVNMQSMDNATDFDLSDLEMENSPLRTRG
ncbi:hypothetical protein FQN54_003025 [Arachnomyces sp. PD_36]|nr:hypothetical protein FQN54_003025 [Arachnomyces sp. PD_36]